LEIVGRAMQVARDRRTQHRHLRRGPLQGRHPLDEGHALRLQLCDTGLHGCAATMLLDVLDAVAEPGAHVAQRMLHAAPLGAACALRRRDERLDARDDVRHGVRVERACDDRIDHRALQAHRRHQAVRRTTVMVPGRWTPVVSIFAFLGDDRDGPAAFAAAEQPGEQMATGESAAPRQRRALLPRGAERGLPPLDSGLRPVPQVVGDDAEGFVAADVLPTVPHLTPVEPTHEHAPDLPIRPAGHQTFVNQPPGDRARSDARGSRPEHPPHNLGLVGLDDEVRAVQAVAERRAGGELPLCNAGLETAPGVRPTVLVFHVRDERTDGEADLELGLVGVHTVGRDDADTRVEQLLR
jgi:hypothetical protein